MTDTKQFTEESDILKQFMELLNQQNMGGQTQDFMELSKHAAGMQLQLVVMADELQGVRQQIEQLQENQPKSVKENLMAKVECLQGKITDLSERLSAIKDHLVETAAQAVNAFKEKGKSGMCRVVQKRIIENQNATLFLKCCILIYTYYIGLSVQYLTPELKK